MIYKLVNVGQKSGAIAIIFLFANTLGCGATEYVFTAPPEVDREIQEIPKSESEYPLYECDNKLATGENDVFDSHDCICTDCEERSESDSQSSPESASKNDAE